MVANSHCNNTGLEVTRINGPSVLIVDDDPDFVDVTRAILEARDYRVRSACDGDEAMACLEEESPDAIILDVMMRNRAEGFIIARRLKKEDRFAGKLAFEKGTVGIYRDKIVPWDETLQEYYAIRGWTKEGIPTMEKLKELKMENVVEDMKIPETV